jgi:starch phosphorylase
MKFMLNGAVTVGTLDGANVEICDAVGPENILIFGLLAEEAAALLHGGNYSPVSYYQQNENLREAMDQLSRGFGDGIQYQDLTQGLLIGYGGQADPYLLMADFESYANIQQKAGELYRDPAAWNRMSLQNIAHAGRFAADRAVRQYADTIWGVKASCGV